MVTMISPDDGHSDGHSDAHSDGHTRRTYAPAIARRRDDEGSRTPDDGPAG
jgi:ribosomal protein L28